jgi:hypothetical protein
MAEAPAVHLASRLPNRLPSRVLFSTGGRCFRRWTEWREDLVYRLAYLPLRPLSECLLQPSPQHVGFTLRILPKVLFNPTLHLVPGTFDFKLVHGDLDS